MTLTYERRRQCITQIHANLIFQACISLLRCFRTSGTPAIKPKCKLACYPVLSPDGLKLCKFVSRSDLVLISFWMLTIPWTPQEPKKPKQMLVVSYLALQACISLCSVSEKSGALLFLPCSHKNVVAHIGNCNRNEICSKTPANCNRNPLNHSKIMI